MEMECGVRFASCAEPSVSGSTVFPARRGLFFCEAESFCANPLQLVSKKQDKQTRVYFIEAFRSAGCSFSYFLLVSPFQQSRFIVDQAEIEYIKDIFHILGLFDD